MGTITTRKTKAGKIRYRAEIRKNITGYPPFSESKTFSKQSAAEAWLRKRETEIDENPDIMKGRKSVMLLGEAIDRFLSESGELYARTVRLTLKTLKNMPIAALDITKMSRSDFEPVSGATVLQDLRMMRVVLNRAELLWGYPAALHEFDRALEGLMKSRVVHSSKQRDVLPSADDLRRLTLYFYRDWLAGKTIMPVHLIMWLAIYTARREAELTCLDLRDFDRDSLAWTARDLKSPYGSEGNHKAFAVLPQVLPLVDLLLSPLYRSLPMRERIREAGLPCPRADRYCRAAAGVAVSHQHRTEK